MIENDEKILNLAFDILKIKTKKELALLLGYAKTSPQGWKKQGELGEKARGRLKNLLESKLLEKEINSNNTLHRRFVELFVDIDIEDDDTVSNKKVFNNNIKNLSGVLINDNNGTIHINKKDFNHGEDIQKLIELLKYAPSEFINNMIDRLEKFKEDSIIK